MDGQVGAIVDRVHHLVDVRQVELWVDALRVHVERDGHEVAIARALAIAEQAALDAVGPAITPSSAAATPVPRSLCVWSEMTTESRFGMLRPNHSIWSA